MEVSVIDLIFTVLVDLFNMIINNSILKYVLYIVFISIVCSVITAVLRGNK